MNSPVKNPFEAAMADSGALINTSHIVYTSGRHGESYVNKDAIYPHTQLTSHLCRAIADAFRSEHIEVVVGPALGGIILAQWVAFHLTALGESEVLGVYAEKDAQQKFVIKRGYDKLMVGRRTLIVEDVLTTGGSVREVVELTRSIGADVRGVGALCNRGAITESQVGNVPRLFCLTQLNLQSWEANECPLCARKVPINLSVGKGREFLAQFS